ncbi:MAG: protoporphyrinogen oxidase [Clostridia bacterium]|nr:protoporphyrinogen oxidase [Clostridia bacterium]
MSKQTSTKVNLQKAEAVAQFVGLTARRIYQLTDEGILSAIETSEGRRYDFNETVRSYIKYLQGISAGKEVNLSEAQAKKRKTEAEIKYRVAKARKAELELEELEGTMYRADDIAAVISDLVYFVRATALALPGRLAIDTAAAQTPSEASVVIKSEVDKFLQELTNYEYTPQKFKDRQNSRGIAVTEAENKVKGKANNGRRKTP